jgi:hypothetical protein
MHKELSSRIFISKIYYLILKLLKSTYTLISTSTPLGNSNFIRASIVLEDEE